TGWAVPPDSDRGRREWAPPLPAVVAAGGGAVVFAVAAWAVGGDAAGTVLLSIAAVLLAAATVNWAAVRPRLVLDTTGAVPQITVRTLTARHQITPEQLHRLRVVRYPRLGRRVPILEIDVRAPEERLLMLTRWDLGASPDAVFTALDEAGMA